MSNTETMAKVVEGIAIIRASDELEKANENGTVNVEGLHESKVPEYFNDNEN